MLEPILSLRAGTIVARKDRPWWFARPQTYHPETNPSGLISFALAENKLVTSELEALAKTVTMKPIDWSYRGTYNGGLELPNILATHINEYLTPYKPITSANLQIVASCTALHDILAWALADEGDVFLTSRPVYGRLELDFPNESGVSVRYADSDAETCFDASVVDKFEEALEEAKRQRVKVKAVFIINPHNPLGRCYPKDTLIALMKFCARHRLHLISDEIYACSVFESSEPGVVPFTSALSIDSEQYIDPKYLHVTYGVSKDFGAAGLKLGTIITRSQAVLHAVDSVMRFHSPSGPSIAIARAMLGGREWCRDFIDRNREKLAAAHRHATKGLKEIGVKYLPGSNAGFFLWIDLSSYLPQHRVPEFALAQKLVDNGVFLHPQEEKSLTPGWFRLVYTQDPSIVTEGLERIKAAIS